MLQLKYHSRNTCVKQTSFAKTLFCIKKHSCSNKSIIQEFAQENKIKQKQKSFFLIKIISC